MELQRIAHSTFMLVVITQHRIAQDIKLVILVIAMWRSTGASAHVGAWVGNRTQGKRQKKLVALEITKYSTHTKFSMYPRLDGTCWISGACDAYVEDIYMYGDYIGSRNLQFSVILKVDCANILRVVVYVSSTIFSVGPLVSTLHS